MYVVAGVSGKVGSVVARELLAQKQKVKVLVRDAKKGEEWSKLGAEVAQGSLSDQAFLTGALRGAAGLFTLLPPPPFTETDFYGAQRKTADAIAGAVKASNVPRVVFLSSVGADLESGTGPIRGLHYLENKLRETGTTLTAIRAGYFQENVGNVLGAVKQMGIFPNFNGSADYAYPMVATVDIGKLAAKELQSKPAKSDVVDLHGPSYSTRQVAEKLGKALGKTITVTDIPKEGWVPAMQQGGMPQHIAEVFAEMYGGFASGKIVPKGDRMEHGKTEIDHVIKKLVS
jgi:uncharacterized protein YbjT (DUF2867 family)